jgi:D-alanine-D-alanine ligase
MPTTTRLDSIAVHGEPPADAGGLEVTLDRLRDRLRIAVVHGADKSVPGAVLHTGYNARPWKSYKAVAEDIVAALGRLGFRHVVLMADDVGLIDRLQRERIDLAWLNTGGVQGFNPMAHAPAMLELAGIPYIGHDPLTVGTLDNKHAFKRDLICLGLPTSPFITWHMSRGPLRPKVNSRFAKAFRGHWGPFIVKPVSGRASLHVHVVEREEDLPDAVADVFEATMNHVLIEGYLPGREFCIAACGPVVAHRRQLQRRPDPFVFSAVERVLEADERIVTSMDVKPITVDRLRALDPEREPEIVASLSEIARQVYLDFNLETLVRLDLREDAAGKIHILEANPKPDLKLPSGRGTNVICAGLGHHGMDYDDLILSLIADRIDYLLRHRRLAVQHLTALLA